MPVLISCVTVWEVSLQNVSVLQPGFLHPILKSIQTPILVPSSLKPLTPLKPLTFACSGYNDRWRVGSTQSEFYVRPARCHGNDCHCPAIHRQCHQLWRLQKVWIHFCGGKYFFLIFSYERVITGFDCWVLTRQEQESWKGELITSTCRITVGPRDCTQF